MRTNWTEQGGVRTDAVPVPIEGTALLTPNQLAMEAAPPRNESWAVVATSKEKPPKGKPANGASAPSPAPKSLPLLDALRVTHDDDLGQILLHHPGLAYGSVRKRIPRPLYSKNLLQAWMIDRVNKEHAIARSLASMASDRKERFVDIRLVYDRYCQNRDPPTDGTISKAACIGMTVTRNCETGLPSYVGVFLWPWGQWICPVDQSADSYHIDRETLLAIFTEAAKRGIPVVHCERHMPCVLGHIFAGMKQSDACFPDFVSVGEASEIWEMVWKHFGIDTVSWHVYMDLARLSEPVPKNPIFASYIPAWKLRWEQMAKMCCDSLSCVCLFERKLRLIKRRLSL